MKKLFFLAIAALSTAVNAKAQNFTQATADVRFVDSTTVFNTTIFSSKNLKGKWGVSYFALVTEGWAEAYAGPTYSVNQKLTLGVSIGMEIIDPLVRGAASATYFGEKFSFLLFFEKGIGNGNYWYALTSEYTPKKFGFGVIGKRFYGVGPSLSYPIKSFKVTVSPLYDIEIETWKPTMFVAYVF